MRFVIFFFLLLSFCCHGQSYLLLKKKNRPYNVVFKVGEKLRFKLKGERFFTESMITGFGDNYIQFHYYKIALDEIAVIDVKDKKFTVFSFTSGPGKLMISGIALLSTDQFNQMVIRHEPFNIQGDIAKIAGSLTLSGILLRLIQKKRWKLNKKTHLIEIIK